MTYNTLMKKEKWRQSFDSHLNFKVLKGFPCPFCRSKEVALEKADYETTINVEVRVLCKYCRKVENYLLVTFADDRVLVKNRRTCLMLSDDIFLDMTDKVYKVVDQKHKFQLELEPFFINYLDISKVVEKIEMMAVFA